jgi:hypothetical protein
LRTSRLALLLALCASPALADEPLFGYVYTTDLLPQGRWEVEQWTTVRHGQSRGSYTNVPMRTELEYGITDRLQGSLYLNYSYLNAYANGVNDETSGPGVPENADPSAPYRSFRYDSVSAELIYRILSPYTDAVGAAVYVEPEIGPRERAIETRVILQKNFIDDRLVLAYNLLLEWEWERQTGNPLAPPGTPEASARTDRHAMLEHDFGVSYRILPRWAIGVEARNHNEFEGHSFSRGAQEHSAWFLGPNIHYGAKQWFATLTWLWQTHARAYTDEQREALYNGRIYGDEHTRLDGVRLKVGYYF